MRKVLFFNMALITFTLSMIAGMLVVAFPYLEFRFKPEMVKLMALSMTAAEKQSIYDRIVQNAARSWDTVPEPDVGRIGIAGLHMISSEVSVDFNNAGMRSVSLYKQKSSDTYRIVCLGDSFVMGEAGLEEDRWCNLLQDWFTENNIKVEGKQVETMAVGLSSWTMLQEATYMTSRMSSYDPDLVIMLTVGNDITPSMGVTGMGFVTNEFSPEARQFGSGLFNNAAGWPFGSLDASVANSDWSTTGNNMWDDHMSSMKRLAEVQNRRGRSILFSVLNPHSVFVTEFEENYRKHYENLKIPADQMSIGLLQDTKFRLPHDGHPSRLGHELLRNQYIHALAKLGWINIPDSKLPKLPEGIPSPVFNRPPSANVAQWSKEFLDSPYLTTKIDFRNLTKEKTSVFLGGIFPAHNRMENYFSEAPYASIRAGFMLRTLQNDLPQKIELDIAVPDKAELFPLSITMQLDGGEEKTFTFESPGNKNLAMNLPDLVKEKPVVEITLLSNHYFTEIEEHRMKVFQLVNAAMTNSQ